MHAFKKRYPQANKLKNEIGKYGNSVYKNDKNMIFELKSHTISYIHKDIETMRIYLDVSGDVKTIKVELKLLNNDKTLVNKGKSSTAVNLIHAIDAVVLLRSRLKLSNDEIDTQAIHDCFISHPNLIKEVIEAYNFNTLSSLIEADLESILPGFKYPKNFKVIDEEYLHQNFQLSDYSLMPT